MIIIMTSAQFAATRCRRLCNNCLQPMPLLALISLLLISRPSEQHNHNQNHNPNPSHHQHLKISNNNNEESKPVIVNKPVIISQPQEFVVGAGENLTLSCTARGAQPLTFVWFQDEKNLTGDSSHATTSTKLLEERRYEIQEEHDPPNTTTSMLHLMNLKITDTSVFLCWVENGAGFTIANFSLIVKEPLPGETADYLFRNVASFFGLDPSGLLVALLMLLLTAAVICLIVLKHITSSKFNNSSTQSKSSCDKDSIPDADDADADAESDERSSNEGNNNTRVIAAAELDSFIDHMRSGIINMDYHSMSPVMQFNDRDVKQPYPVTPQYQPPQYQPPQYQPQAYQPQQYQPQQYQLKQYQPQLDPEVGVGFLDMTAPSVIFNANHCDRDDIANAWTNLVVFQRERQ